MLNLIKLIKKIPYVKKKIRAIKPNIEDVLYEFYKPETKITYLDIGANTGQTIDFVEKNFRNATVHSFEPTADLFKSLQEKYKSNTDVFLYNIALSNENKQLDFYSSEFSPTNSCLKPNIALYEDLSYQISKTLAESNKTKVKGQRLDTWYNENLNDELIDIIKIDTQGFEYEVISGGINTLKDKTKLLYFEIQYLDFYENARPFYEIFELLYNNGFYYYCQLSSNKRKKYQVLESDVLFVNKKFFKPNF